MVSVRTCLAFAIVSLILSFFLFVLFCAIGTCIFIAFVCKKSIFRQLYRHLKSDYSRTSCVLGAAGANHNNSNKFDNSQRQSTIRNNDDDHHNHHNHHHHRGSRQPKHDNDKDGDERNGWKESAMYL